MNQLPRAKLRDLFPLRRQSEDAPPCPVCGERTLWAGYSSGTVIYQTDDTTYMSCEEDFYRCDSCNITVVVCLTDHKPGELSPS